MSFEVTTVSARPQLILSPGNVAIRILERCRREDGHRVRDNRRLPAVADQADLLFREGRNGDRSLQPAERQVRRRCRSPD